MFGFKLGFSGQNVNPSGKLRISDMCSTHFNSLSSSANSSSANPIPHLRYTQHSEKFIKSIPKTVTHHVLRSSTTIRIQWPSPSKVSPTSPPSPRKRIKTHFILLPSQSFSTPPNISPSYGNHHSPPLATRVRNFVNDTYNFFGLYFSSLLSVRLSTSTSSFLLSTSSPGENKIELN